jgi:hypothetical protein
VTAFTDRPLPDVARAFDIQEQLHPGPAWAYVEGAGRRQLAEAACGDIYRTLAGGTEAGPRAGAAERSGGRRLLQCEVQPGQSDASRLADAHARLHTNRVFVRKLSRDAAV